jgi:hypothetical protein
MQVHPLENDLERVTSISDGGLDVGAPLRG